MKNLPTYPPLRHCRQAAGEHASRGASPHDDEVEHAVVQVVRPTLGGLGEQVTSRLVADADEDQDAEQVHPGVAARRRI